jgi:hypothetical protein
VIVWSIEVALVGLVLVVGELEVVCRGAGAVEAEDVVDELFERGRHVSKATIT